MRLKYSCCDLHQNPLFDQSSICVAMLFYAHQHFMIYLHAHASTICVVLVLLNI